jgi:hypothetical protein
MNATGFPIFNRLSSTADSCLRCGVQALDAPAAHKGIFGILDLFQAIDFVTKGCLNIESGLTSAGFPNLIR